MITVKNVSLLALQSAHMQRDPTTVAMCAALDEQFHQLADDVKLVLIYGRLDQLGDDVLDELAVQMQVDWYDSKAVTEEKRKVIKSCIKVHRYRGTVYAVKQVVADVFGKDAKVLEWFRYGGQPYYFKVHVYCKERGVNNEDIARAESLITSAKNLRSRLEAILLFLLSEGTCYAGCAFLSSEKTIVKPRGGI